MRHLRFRMRRFRRRKTSALVVLGVSLDLGLRAILAFLSIWRVEGRCAGCGLMDLLPPMRYSGKTVTGKRTMMLSDRLSHLAFERHREANTLEEPLYL